MAYETGTATGPIDLLAKLAVFAAAQGWTINRNTAGAGFNELCLSKGAAYFNLKAYQNIAVLVNGANPATPATRYGIALNGSDGYSAPAAWDRQPGYPVRTAGTAGTDQAHANMPCYHNPGPFPAYYFFAPDAKCIYVELEESVGIFVRLGFGSLDLFNVDAPGGGRFFYATGGIHPTVNTFTVDVDGTAFMPELVPFRMADFSTTPASSGSFLRAAYGAFDGWANSARTAVASLTSECCIGGGVHDKVLRDSGANPLNGVAMMLPNIVSVNRANEYLMPVGVVPGMRYMDMSGHSAANEFALGPDTWKVFPWFQQGGVTFQRGISLLKVT